MNYPYFCYEGINNYSLKKSNKKYSVRLIEKQGINTSQL